MSPTLSRQRFRCLLCGGYFWGQRVCCNACNAQTVERAKLRVKCGRGHSRRPDQPCLFCLANTGKVNIGEKEA